MDTEIINDRVSFFYSFFQFAETLKSTESRCNFYDMVFRYAFFGEHPAEDDSFLYGTFLLIKPNIDVNIKRTVSGIAARKKRGHKEDKEIKEDKEEDIGTRNKDIEKGIGEGIRNNQSQGTSEDTLQGTLKGYPKTVEDVIKLAENNCILFPKDEAERYLNYRQSSDWKKKTGQQITVGGIVSDIKIWLARSKQFHIDQQQSNIPDDDCISDDQYEAEMNRKRNSRSPSMLEDRT